MFKSVKNLLFAAALTSLGPFYSPAFAQNGLTSGDPLEIRFVGVFIEADFFKPVIKGMQEAADLFGAHAVWTGTKGADTDAQNALIRQYADEGVDGIAVDIIHPTANNDAIAYAMSKGVPVVAFNVDATNGKGPHLAFTQQYFVDAGEAIANHVIADIAEGATVLVTQHDPGVSALQDRAQGIKNVLARKNVNLIELVLVNDGDKSKAMILEALAANPEISAIMATGNADTFGAGMAVSETGGSQLVAGFDLSETILNFIKDGTIRATIDQQPYMQGFYPVAQLALNSRYGLLPSNIDAGSGLVTAQNVDAVMALSAAGYR